MRAALLACLLLAPTALFAEVVSSAAQGFTVRTQVTVPQDPAQAWKLFGAVSRWWDKDHTFSGDSRNLSLRLAPGGCFCERLARGGHVEHLRVVYLEPGRMLRMAGGLGPMQALGVSGVYTVEFKPEGTGTRVTATYAVGGWAEPPLDRYAAVVDQVMTLQLNRFATHAAER